MFDNFRPNNVSNEQAAINILQFFDKKKATKALDVIIKKNANLDEYTVEDVNKSQETLSKRLLEKYALFEPDKYRMAQEGSIELAQFETEIKKYKARRKGPVNEQIYKVWNELVENAFYLGKFIEETYKIVPKAELFEPDPDKQLYDDARKKIMENPLQKLAPDLYDFVRTGGERREQENK